MDVFHYRVKVRIEPELQRLEAEVQIDAPPSNRFYLNRGFAVSRLTAGGKAVSFHEDLSDEKTPFDMLGTRWFVEADEPGRILLKYGGEIHETVFGCNMITPELVELALYTAWCPLFDGLRQYTFELELDMPEGYVTTTNGRRTARRSEAGREISQWSSYGPGADIVVLASPNLRMLEAKYGDAEAEVYFRDLAPESMTAEINRLLKAKAKITDLYGPARVDGVLRLVYSPREGQGYVRTPFIVVSEERAKRAFEETHGEADSFSQDCHELAHFWWWLLGAVFTSEDWINEGLAEFTSFRICRDEFGEEFAAKCIADYRRKIAECETDCSIAETPYESPDREANYYSKPTLMYIEAERRFGAERLDAFLSALHNRFAGTSNATTAAFLEEVERTMGKDAEAFFREELHRKNEIAPAAE